jgi:hypothetical protein
MSYRTFALGIAALALLGPARPAVAQTPETVHQALLKQAPKVFDYLRTHKAKTVGVLKFLVQEGDGTPSDRVGLLNQALADRLEIALVLAPTPKQIKANDYPEVLHRASEAAAKLPGANHLTAAGRAVLFKGTYPPAWGDGKPVPADAFVTGVARLSPDLKRLTVTLQGLHKGGTDLDEITRFSVATDISSLVESGANFSLSGPRRGMDEIVTRSARIRKAGKAAAHPLLSADSPVTLEVLYNGKPALIAVGADMEAKVEEPREDQEVTFRVVRRDGVKGTLAVVLLVNGENTLFRQRGDALQCAKWILPGDQKELLIKGFQTDEKKSAAFKVLSREESKPNEVYYGHDVGLVSLVVYREQGGMPPASLSGPTENELAVQGAQVPNGQANNFFALRAQLRSGGSRGQDHRGLIVPGKEAAAALQVVSFRADPTPVMSATVRYYAKQK